VGRGLEHLGRRALLDDPAGVHDGDPLACLGQHRQVVGDQQQGQPELAPQLRQQGEDLGLDHHVQGGGGLVGDQQAGRAGQGHGDHHPLALAPRQLVG
jgi:hypothetical protein